MASSIFHRYILSIVNLHNVFYKFNCFFYHIIPFWKCLCCDAYKPRKMSDGIILNLELKAIACYNQKRFIAFARLMKQIRKGAY